MSETIRGIVAAKGRVVVEASPEESVADVVTRMYEYGVGSVVITNNGVVCGMLTKRDVFTRVVVARRRAEETMARDIMSTELVTVTLGMPAADALALMDQTHYRHLPVVENGQLRGLVAKGDLTRWLLHDNQLRISDLLAYITRA